MNIHCHSLLAFHVFPFTDFTGLLFVYNLVQMICTCKKYKKNFHSYIYMGWNIDIQHCYALRNHQEKMLWTFSTTRRIICCIIWTDLNWVTAYSNIEVILKQKWLEIRFVVSVVVTQVEILWPLPLRKWSGLTPKHWCAGLTPIVTTTMMMPVVNHAQGVQRSGKSKGNSIPGKSQGILLWVREN